MLAQFIIGSFKIFLPKIATFFFLLENKSVGSVLPTLSESDKMEYCKDVDLDKMTAKKSEIKNKITK